MNLKKLIQESNKLAKKYATTKKLGKDEELQMLSCAYAQLFLVACAKGSTKDLAASHKLIARCFKKLSDKKWSSRHTRLAKSYLK